MSDVEQLIETALDTSAGSFRRRMAVSELVKSGDSHCAETLVPLLKDDDQYLRREVVAALKDLGDSVTVVPLIDALGDADDYVKRDAALALAELGDRRAHEPLRSLQETGSYTVREAAKRALDELEKKTSMQRVSEGPALAPSRLSATISPATPVNIPPTPASPALDPPVAEGTGSTTATGAEPDTVAEGGNFILSDKPTHERETTDLSEQQEDKPLAAGITFVETAEFATRTETADVESEVSPSGETVAVLAEIVDESLPAIGDDQQDVTCFATTVPGGFSWGRARRFQARFADGLSSIQAAYQQLVQRQQTLVDLEQQHHETLTQLGFQRADKDDDIARCEEDIDAVKDTILRLERTAARDQRELRSLERQSVSFWHQAGSIISPDKEQRVQQLRGELESSLREVGRKISEARRELETHQRQHAMLVQPVQQLRTATDKLTSQRDEALQAIAQANEGVNQQIMETVRRLSAEELNSRLQQLMALDDRDDCLVTCIQRLMGMLAELAQRSVESAEVESSVNEAAEAAHESVGQLATSIADGFVVSSVEMQTPFRLTGSIRFQEEHSLFGGYSGASGSASGSGSGQAVYEVEQLRWNLPQDLDRQLAAFTAAWELCGERHAQQQATRRRLSTCEQSISEYIGLLRSELERDFPEQCR